MRVQKAYPGKHPPPPAQGEAKLEAKTEPKAYKEMPRKPVPEACLPATLPMPAFLTPPPKARPRSSNATPRASTPTHNEPHRATEVQQGPPPEEPELVPAKASPRAIAKKEMVQKEVGDFIPHDARLKCDFHRIEKQHVPEELRIDHPDSGLLLPDLSVFLTLSFFLKIEISLLPAKDMVPCTSLTRPTPPSSGELATTAYSASSKTRVCQGLGASPILLLLHYFRTGPDPTVFLLLTYASCVSSTIGIRTALLILCSRTMPGLVIRPFGVKPGILMLLFVESGVLLPPRACATKTMAFLLRLGRMILVRRMIHGEDSTPALSHRSPPPPPPFNLDPAANIPPPAPKEMPKPRYSKSGLKESEVQFHRENFPDDPDSSGSSMDDGYQEFTFPQCF